LVSGSARIPQSSARVTSIHRPRPASASAPAPE
jgi:hypothetical protein